jgi:N-acetylmuramoyl-L-alanine amidase CwlA
MSLSIIQQIIPVGHPNRPGRKLASLKAIVVHFTDNDNPGMGDVPTAKWLGRAWHKGADGRPWEWISKWGKDDFGKWVVVGQVEIPFRYGSAQVIIDEDSVTYALPLNEGAWSVGDARVIPRTAENKGQKPVAKNLFYFNQNFETLNVEICNNGDWDKAASNAASWIRNYLSEQKLCIDMAASLEPQSGHPYITGTVWMLRHFDITGKICPRPFVDNSAAWKRFIEHCAI